MGKDAKKRRHYSYQLGRFSMVEVVITDGPGTARIHQSKTAPFGIAISKTVTGSFSGPDQIAGTDAIQGIIGEKMECAINTELRSAKMADMASKQLMALLIPSDEPGAGEPVTKDWLIADRDKWIGKTGNVTGYGWKGNIVGRLGCDPSVIDRIYPEQIRNRKK